jgi:DEAD/DEAH box helicase domain-containing protein
VARVIGFKKIRFYTNENVGSGELDLPEQQMHTTSYWLTVPKDVLASLPDDSEAKRDGVSGMAQAMRTVAQLLLMCDRNDLGVSVNAEGEAATGAALQVGAERESGRSGAEASAKVSAHEEPRIFIYDNYPGGIGFSAPLFEVQDRLLEASADLIAGCECARGCPSCVGPIGEIGPHGKRVALALLERLTGRVAVSAAVRPAIDEGEVPF